MKRFSEQLHKQSQSLKLTKSEQADLRDRVVSYMEYHPLPAAVRAKAPQAAPAKKTARPILTDAFTHIAIPYHQLFKWGSVAAVFVLVVIPFMAERTVPGDALYAVKVQFNEEVRSTLTWGSYEKVEWETTRLNRRIAEARLLADEGLLTEEVEATVAAAVKEHSDNAKREIEVLRASDADEATIATIAFDSSLEVQAKAFDRSAPPNADQAVGSTTPTGTLISVAIDQSLEKNPNEQPAEVPSYAKLMARVELNTTRVRELRDSLVDVVLEQELADVTRRIEDIDRVVSEAIDLGANPETELAAREKLVTVLTRTQKLIIFMTELEVREEVTVEDVVPVVLTPDEMSIDRSKRITKLETAVAKLNASMQKLTNQELRAKLVDTNQKLTATLSTLGGVTNYEAFVVQSDEALALAADALLLLEIEGVAVSVPIVPVVATTSASTTDPVAETPATATSTNVSVNEQSETEGVDPVTQETQTELDESA